MTMSVALMVTGTSVTVKVPHDADVTIERVVEVDQPAEPDTGQADWLEIVHASEFAELELAFSTRAQERGWVVERAQSTGPHAKDISVYPPVGMRRVRLAAFYGPTARVAFHNRVREEDRREDRGVKPIYDYAGTPREKFTGLFIELRRTENVDTALDVAQLVYERIA